MRPGSSQPDYYDVLGADESTSSRDLERLYKRMAARCHPDKGGSEEAMKLLNEAYAVLKDRSNRREYNLRRKLLRYQIAVPVTKPAAGDIGAFGRFLSAFLCLVVGLFLLFLVRFQWIWFLWPLAILALLVILFGVMMARSAMFAQAALFARNPFRGHELVREAVFWMLVVSGGFGLYLILTAVE